MRPTDLRKNTTASDLWSVSVSSCCHQKIPQTRRVGPRQHTFISHSSEGWESMIKLLFPVRISFLVCRWSFLSVPLPGGEWVLCVSSSPYKGTKPLQYSCLENPMDGGAWQAAVHGVATSRTRLSDFTFTFHFSLSCIGEGNGNPLQCSCLENPRDGGAWWAAIYGVAQSQTGLKRLSSSSSNPITGTPPS